ncbi:hypothetical protein AB9K35_16990 [Leisingera sp. XS_AS12]|uniref:hypothetical protein n=1 Tax=Leisingera sp. XS_AS12 TaxID=3241294 RepID=UPI0035166913
MTRVSKGEQRRRSKAAARQNNEPHPSPSAAETRPKIGLGLSAMLSSFKSETAELRKLTSSAIQAAKRAKAQNTAAEPQKLSFDTSSQREMALRLGRILDLEMLRYKGEKRTTIHVRATPDFLDEFFEPLLAEMITWQSALSAAASTEVERVVFQEATGRDFSYGCSFHGIDTWLK